MRMSAFRESHIVEARANKDDRVRPHGPLGVRTPEA